MSIIAILITLLGPAIGAAIRYFIEQWLENREVPRPLRVQARRELVAIARECVVGRRGKRTGRVRYEARVTEAEAVQKLEALRAKWEPQFAAALATADASAPA